LQSIVNQTGENQTWNFQSLPFILDTTTDNNYTVVAYPGGAPIADSFPVATHVQIESSGGNTYYEFYKIDQTGFYAIGESQVQNGTASFVGKYYPPLEYLALPLTYQTSWTSTSTTSVEGINTTQEVDGYVDGWGSYTLPGNNSSQALRVRTKTINVSLPIIIGKDTIVPGYTDISYSFVWFSPSSYSATINADSNQNATDAEYSVYGALNSVIENNSILNYSISVGSNPVTFLTNVSFTMPSESEVNISLMDPLGRQSQLLMNGMAHPGLNTLPLDPANLVNGTYFLRIQSDGYSEVQKIIVAH
jgi:hypothetical protein